MACLLGTYYFKLNPWWNWTDFDLGSQLNFWSSWKGGYENFSKIYTYTLDHKRCVGGYIYIYREDVLGSLL